MKPSEFQTLDIERDVMPALQGVCRFLGIGMSDEPRVPMFDVLVIEGDNVTMIGACDAHQKANVKRAQCREYRRVRR